MKTFWKILGGIVAFIIILVVAINLYFTNERLKNTVMPYITDAVGSPVTVETMSLSFFSTFPQPGLEMENISIQGSTSKDTLISLDRLVVGVELFSLFSDEIEISELVFGNPKFTYIIYTDSTTNLDFLFEEETDTTSSGSYSINIPYFEVYDGFFGYKDLTSNTSLNFANVDGDLSLRYGETIETEMDLKVARFSAAIDSIDYVNGLPISLSEASTLYPDREVLELKKSVFSLRGLQLDLSGNFTNWSDTMAVDLQFASASDDFGALLKLVPETYADYTEGLESRGSLTLQGTIDGMISENHTPAFKVQIDVNKGYLKDPDLPKPIENIQISAVATNEFVAFDTLQVTAGANNISGTGKIEGPLTDNPLFTADFVADIDLSTVHNFYDLAQTGIEQLSGNLDVDATAQGSFSKPEAINFNGYFVLADARLKYEEVAEAITNINIEARGSNQQLTLESLSAQAAQNSISAEGEIQHILDEGSRYINMNANLHFDLATLGRFYPVDEDTVQLEGILDAQVTLNGAAEQIEESVQQGTITLKNGMIDYYKWETPIRDIAVTSVLEGDQMVITKSSFKSGDSRVSITGAVNNYISENRSVNLIAKGNIKLNQIKNYYELQPDITQLTGEADFDLNIKGAFDKPAELALSGQLALTNMNVAGEMLTEPVENLHGTLILSPEKAVMDTLAFGIGSSDIHLSGSLQHYMQFLKDEGQRTATPVLKGRYFSNYLNVDELIDWSDTTSSFTLELPEVNSTIQGEIGRLMVFGVTMTNIEAKISATPVQIILNNAIVNLFEGTARGIMLWNIPEEGPSTFSFNGELDSLRMESFFSQYPILGTDSEFYKYIAGTFHSKVEYKTKIDSALNPMIPTTTMLGSFGMNSARINNHPLQQKIAGFLNIEAIRNVTIDNWESAVSINNSVLTLSDLSISSNNIGLELNGTQHLVTDKIDFNVNVILPERYKEAVASVITSRAVDALARDDGSLRIPLRITGTYSNMKIMADKSVIEPLIKNYLKNKAGNVLQNLFNRNNQDEQKVDTTVVDTTNRGV